MPSTPDLIKTGVEHFQSEVPALAKLKLVFELELQGRGDVQMYRVELPGPKIEKALADDAKLTVHIPRAQFNELAEEGTIKQYREAYETGLIKVTGDQNFQKLIGQVVTRQEARAATRKVH
ncbi:MAG: hypothetical protein EXQ70_07435 [Solirubrobacterales bacterium]|nr:hypothetical protein [Solirubrobacterales bacterium]